MSTLTTTFFDDIDVLVKLLPDRLTLSDNWNSTLTDEGHFLAGKCHVAIVGNAVIKIWDQDQNCNEPVRQINGWQVRAKHFKKITSWQGTYQMGRARLVVEDYNRAGHIFFVLYTFKMSRANYIHFKEVVENMLGIN